MGPALTTRLVTQMYFPDDPLFELDPIFQSVPEHARARLVADLRPRGDGRRTGRSAIAGTSCCGAPSDRARATRPDAVPDGRPVLHDAALRRGRERAHHARDARRTDPHRRVRVRRRSQPHRGRTARAVAGRTPRAATTILPTIATTCPLDPGVHRVRPMRERLHRPARTRSSRSSRARCPTRAG